MLFRCFVFTVSIIYADSSFICFTGNFNNNLFSLLGLLEDFIKIGQMCYRVPTLF